MEAKTAAGRGITTGLSPQPVTKPRFLSRRTARGLSVTPRNSLQKYNAASDNSASRYSGLQSRLLGLGLGLALSLGITAAPVNADATKVILLPNVLPASIVDNCMPAAFKKQHDP